MAHESSSLPGYDALAKRIRNLGENHGVFIPWWTIALFFLVSLFVFHAFAPAQSRENWSFVLFFSPLWIPVILFKSLWGRWYEYIRWRTVSGTRPLLLEIRIPREVLKTPLAMETVLSSLHIGIGENTWHKRSWLGKVRPWWSLEIASFEGQVHFYIWTVDYMRAAVENYFYAQYPDIEIVEAEDYSRIIDPVQPTNDVKAFEFKHGKPDPYPIRTYIDYGLDKQGPAEPNELVDPMSQMLEFMGSIGPGQQLWLQIVFRVTKGDKFKGKKTKDGNEFTWKDEAREEIEKIRAKTKGKVNFKDPVTGEMREGEGFPNPTKGESETMAAIERNVSKLGFDVGIRTIYFEEKARPYPAAGGLLSNMLKPFNSGNLNSFGPAETLSAIFKDFPWEDRTGERRRKEMKEGLERYRRRAFFYPPYAPDHIMTLSTEELATLFHIPSSTVSTPSIPRLQSRTAEAPANLPT